MNFEARLKELRAEKKVTQAQLAEALDVSTSCIANWESGRRVPSIGTINALSNYFDRRTDYILGQSNDKSSPKLSEEDIEQLGMWAVEENMEELFLQYFKLDEFGQYAVETAIKTEFMRCKAQDTLNLNPPFAVRVKCRRTTK